MKDAAAKKRERNEAFLKSVTILQVVFAEKYVLFGVLFLLSHRAWEGLRAVADRGWTGLPTHL